MANNGILFPLEIGSVDLNCIICFEKLQWAVFCPRCKQGNCYHCLERWFTNKRQCPKCRYGFQMPAGKYWYSCTTDANLVEFFCEQCNVCICRECRRNPSNEHIRHTVRSLDALRKEMIDATKDLKSEVDVLKVIKSLILVGNPLEWVQQRLSIQALIKNLKPIIVENCENSTHCYNLPGVKFFECSFFLSETNGEKQLFSDNDQHGNTWELTAYPGGYSDAKGKFISLYLKLIQGTPMLYEYRFMIFDTNTLPLESYFAVDNFTVGSQSMACQRLISIDQARLKASVKNGYRMAYATRPTNPEYGIRCAIVLAENRYQRTNFKKFTYTVQKFSDHKSANRILFSNIILDQQNISWRFRIDCNGHWEQNEYISVFLELLNGTEGWFDIFIKMVNLSNPAISFERKLTHKFSVHSNWGVPHFMQQSALYKYLHDDQLVFQFGMRPAHVEMELE